MTLIPLIYRTSRISALVGLKGWINKRLLGVHRPISHLPKRKEIMEVEDLKIAVTRLHKLDSKGPTKALCDISIADSFVVHGLRIIEGKDGLFVAMPREEGKDGKWYNTVIPLKREVKDEIERIVLEAYGC